MEKNKIETDLTYHTSDIYIAAFLISKQYPFSYTSEGNRIIFSFPSESIEAVKQFLDGTGTVSVRTFTETLKTLKTLVKRHM